MPANLTPGYLAAEAKYRSAETNEEKLDALEEMYATIPKHKGTEKLQADIKRRMSKLRDKEKQAAKQGKKTDLFHVIRQGAGQIVLVGPPNSGKSTIVAMLTSAETEMDECPFSTRAPAPGMMHYEDIQIQLIDTPSISSEHYESGVIGLVRNADAIAVVLDCSDDALLDQFEDIREEMSNSRMSIASKPIYSPSGTIVRPAFVVANKVDISGSEANLDVLRDVYGDEFIIQPVSAETGEGLENLKQAMFESLHIIRIYSKIPGKPADMSKPFTIRKGSTLLDFAALVHKDFINSLSYARVWGKSTLDGAHIGKDHVLNDGDVVELHT